MRNIYKYINVVWIAAAMSCTKDITSLNVNPKVATSVPSETLYSNAQKNLMDQLETSDVNTNIFRLLSQQWTETTYTDEARYNLGTRNIPEYWWDPYYRDVLRNLIEAKNLITADDTYEDAQLKTNQLALIDILEVYSFSILVDTYGDIPYTDALNIDNLQPKYDDAATIYKDLLSRLDTDLTNIDASSGSFDAADLVYGGDVSKWVKFANSLKLRLGMRLADVDVTASKTAVESVDGKTFSSNDDNAIFQYLSSPPNTNPIWADQVYTGRQDFVPANTLVDIMNGLNDPRIPYYFQLLPDSTTYVGGTYGASSPWPNYSHINPTIYEASFRGVLLDYAETEFYLAEAVERGYTVTGDAQTHYNNAITASIISWGGSAADATAYIATSAVNYTTATGDYKQKIGTQKWIASYDRGFEAWAEYRRLDQPTLNVVAHPEGDFPRRYTYPVSEQNLNTANWSDASKKITGGADVVTAKVFWDVH